MVQEVHKNYTNGFSKKIIQGKWVILGPKMTHNHNSGAALRIFYKFCTIKSPKGTSKLYYTMVYPNKNPIQGNWAFLDPKMTHHNSGSGSFA